MQKKTSSIDYVKITGARENNLKNINLDIPKNKLVVFTGLSGSGKSTLAFDTLYAEGQRRYLESLSSYARQFLDKVGKPEVDKIEGLTPAIAIDQKTTSKNPRSTVGTITEIYDYLRLLYARVGKQHCHKCGKIISHMSSSDIINQVLSLENDTKITILAPIFKERKGTFSEVFENLRQKGYIRVMIDGVLSRLDENIELSKNKKHTIKIVLDRVSINDENKPRIASAIEKGLGESYGEIEILNNETKELIHYSEHFACFDCKVSFDMLEPLSFSFNSPKGACHSCNGLGVNYRIDIKKVINSSLPLNKGGIKIIFGFNKSYYSELFRAFAKSEKIDINDTFESLSEQKQKLILYGSQKEFKMEWKNSQINRIWDGILKIAYDMFKDQKDDLSSYMSEKKCDVCNGYRLKLESLSVKVANKGIGEIIDMPIEDAYKLFNDKNNFSYLSKEQQFIASSILKEIQDRLYFLYDVGLGYLSLGRDSRTISGGENQRIRIASQIGSGLTGVMYVLDEPSIGLHERDTLRLINTLRNLQQKGNTLIVVEHDKETIKQADYIVDIGPGAGNNGGEVIFSGEVEKLKKSNTLTAKYIFGKKDIKYFYRRKQEKWLEINNININNVKNLNIKIPLLNFVCITGVSGSGKSSIVLQTLLPIAQEILNHSKKINKVDGVEINGLNELDKVIYLDQSPIGRTPRSNPATYTGVMDDIRMLFSQTKEAKVRGYNIGRFSFNVKGGRCEKCQGEGEVKIEMHFLPDINVKCDVCNGKKYNDQTLEILYNGKNISDVLNLSVSEALEFFSKIPKITQKLKTIKDIGLGYITLGQNALSLSGGEAQRIKIAKELCKKDTGKTLYILDEPTTGLHFDDIDKLVQVLHHLTSLGNSMIIIEHNLDVIKNADYIIDIGPEGGINGGKIVAYGTPEELIKKDSYTAKFLANELKKIN
ncbi:excinuclease ABC subunit UvrA [Helicobacter sp. MIT 14-3879]|uniref:excinuclease ABC subunit UvrA n=1 Tax=Helicobacter sp. MIT 14-3879 TaxID=2040649 RepID=UPI000E1E8A06|nr:excinuclease ABC subunit UvrA [Helicobacter sp. MIT 14-3879]RDU62902.1 excinuclease ABC subunit A [Helicobacter sp. MIT 14-3879]